MKRFFFIFGVLVIIVTNCKGPFLARLAKTKSHDLLSNSYIDQIKFSNTISHEVRDVGPGAKLI